MTNERFVKSVTVFKSYSFDGNAITGPQCVTPGDSVTYSVAPWTSMYGILSAGIDSCFWDIPVSLRASTLYYSADKSSVTFVASKEIKGQEIKVHLGKYNTGETPLTLALDDEVAKPAIDGLSDKLLCMPLSADPTTLTITNAQPTLKYEWNFRSWGAPEDLTGNGSSVFVKPSNNEEQVTIKVTGGCSTKEFDFVIGRSLSADSKIINSLDGSTCLTPGSNVELEVNNAGSNVACVWFVEGEGWPTSSDSVLSANPTFKVGTSTGYITARSRYCPTVSITDTFSVAPLTPGTIDGSDCVMTTETDALTYSVAKVANADSYSWTVPSGWTINGDANGNTISVTPHSTSNGYVQVSSVGCSTSTPSELQIKRDYPAPTGITVDGCLSIGRRSNVTLRVADPVDGVTYEWSIPPAMGTPSTPVGSSQRLRFKGNEGSYNVMVYPGGTCSSTPPTYDTTIVVSAKYEIAKRYVDGNLLLTASPLSSDATIQSFQWYVDGLEFEELGTGPNVKGAVIFKGDTEWGVYYESGEATLELKYTDGCSETVSTSWPPPYVDDVEDGENKSINLTNDGMSDAELCEGNVIVAPNPAETTLSVTVKDEFKQGYVAINSISGGRACV